MGVLPKIIMQTTYVRALPGTFAALKCCSYVAIFTTRWLPRKIISFTSPHYLNKSYYQFKTMIVVIKQGNYNKAILSIL